MAFTVMLLFNVDEKEQGCKSVTRRHVLYNPNPKKWKHRKCCSCSSCGMLFKNVVNEYLLKYKASFVMKITIFI